jgi:photosystem II stability/assembly factor-like uncharacterized protein
MLVDMHEAFSNAWHGKPVFREPQNSPRQRFFICARIDITFITLLCMHGLAFFVAFLFAGLSCANAQWDIEDSNTTASLRGIHNVGRGVAWASGTDGTVLRTEDDGYLWQTCTIPSGAGKLDFRGIQAFDENTAIVMSSGKGDLSRLYKTTDGCQTWKLLFTNPDKDGFWDAIQFLDAERFPQDRNFGVLLGDPIKGHFPLFTTLDGGEHWERWVNDAPSSRVGESIFAASNSALILDGPHDLQFVTGGVGGARLVSFGAMYDQRQSGRRRWSDNKLALASGASAGAFSIAHRPLTDSHPAGLVSLVVGGDYQRPTSSIGNSSYASIFDFQPAHTPPHGYRSSVAYDPTQRLWITVGPNGTDISADDGKNWHPLTPSGYDPPDADKNWNALSLPFVVGPHGRIGKLNAKALAP